MDLRKVLLQKFPSSVFDKFLILEERPNELLPTEMLLRNNFTVNKYGLCFFSYTCVRFLFLLNVFIQSVYFERFVQPEARSIFNTHLLESLSLFDFSSLTVLEGLKQNVLVRKSVTLMPLNKLHIIMKEACLTEAKRGCSTKYSKPGN